jgi:hypothetical protein
VEGHFGNIEAAQIKIRVLRTTPEHPREHSITALTVHTTLYLQRRVETNPPPVSRVREMLI